MNSGRTVADRPAVGAAPRSVFISYRRGRSWATAQLVRRDLESHGFDVFMDTTKPRSGDFEVAIFAEITARTHFIVIIEEGSLEGIDAEDDWLRREIEQAFTTRRNIIPILTGPIPLSRAALPPEIFDLRRQNALIIHPEHVDDALLSLRSRYLLTPATGTTERRRRPTWLDELTPWLGQRNRSMTSLIAILGLIAAVVSASVPTPGRADGAVDSHDTPVPPFIAGLPTSVGYVAIGASNGDADPCRLVDLSAFTTQGPTRIHPSPFSSCHVWVTLSSREIRVVIDLDGSGGVTGRPRRPPIMLGGIEISSGPIPGSTPYGCFNSLRLSDRSYISISADWMSSSSDMATTCTMVDIATVGAVDALAREGGVPRTDGRLDRSQLAGARACDLVDESPFPDRAALEDSGFGDWSCLVEQDGGDPGSLQVTFGFGPPFASLAGLRPQPKSGWAGRFESRTNERTVGPVPYCTVTLQVRAGSPISPSWAETVTFTAKGEIDRCLIATSAAEKAASRIP